MQKLTAASGWPVVEEKARVAKAKRNQPNGISDTQLVWLPSTLRKFVQLLDLPPNWDGYGARAVEPATAQRALRVLLDAVPPTAPVPYVVPSPAGGVQIEWHEPGGDVEIEFKVDGTASVFIETDDREVEESGPIRRIGRLARQNLGPVFARR
jgi:hypothetical protein